MKNPWVIATWDKGNVDSLGFLQTVENGMGDNPRIKVCRFATREAANRHAIENVRGPYCVYSLEGMYARPSAFKG